MKHGTPPAEHRRRRLLAPVMLAAAAAALSACSLLTGQPQRTVEITRTTHGIAHVTAGDHEGLAFGTAYAYAQDNVCLLANQLATVRGERSQHFGPGTEAQLGLRVLPNEQIDFFIRAHMDDLALGRANAALSPEARAMQRGYVAGYNRYLQDTGMAGLPQECRFGPWVKPMTLSEYWRLTEQGMILGGVGAFADAVLAAAPPGARTGRSFTPRVPRQAQSPEPDLKDAIDELARRSLDRNPEGGELGSNGWAFGANATPDGRGVLLGNPHFPWAGIHRFWQLHQTIPGVLDVMGAASGGSPVVTLGFNRDLAWTHTVSIGRRYTLYELRLDPSDPTVYIVDGQKRKMSSRTITLPPTRAGVPLQQTTVWSSEWGPILVLPRAGLNWTATTAYAIRDANTQNVRSLETWMAMARARNVQALRAAMRNQGIPWANTVAADRQGDVLFADASVVPDVSGRMLKECAPTARAAALFAAAGVPVLDGSRADCAWHRDPAAVAPGLVPEARQPALLTRDWVQNSNDSFWLSHPGQSAGQDISPLSGAPGTPQRLRTRSAILEIQARLAGRDGLPGDRMGLDEVRSVILRNRNHAGLLVVPDLLAACSQQAATLGAEQKEACAVLSRWDRSSHAAAAGAPLFREFWRKASQVPQVWRVPFDAALPVTTPAGLRMDDAAVRDAVFKALGDAAAVLRAAGYPLDVTLGAVQGRELRGQRVPIHGGDEFEGVLNKVESQGQAVLQAGGYRINYGTSYLQAVGFDAEGPVAWGLLAYGQSSDPASLWSFDQLALLSQKQWVRLPFSPAQVQAQRVGQPLVLAY